jgi:hypothetical protein
MRDDDLDRILSRDDEIVPSSGFVPAVMDAVRREAATPPAIPFPWRRALPGLGAWAVTLAAMVAAWLGWTGAPAGPETVPALAGLVEAADSLGAGWILLVLLMSFLSVKLSMRLAGTGE